MKKQRLWQLSMCSARSGKNEAPRFIAIRVCALLLCALLPFPAWSQVTQAYVGAGFMISDATAVPDKVNTATNVLAIYGVSVGGKYDVRRPGAEVFVGVNANRYVAGEAGFMFLGRFSANITASGPGGNASGSAYDDVYALYAAGVARAPITPIFQVYGRAGLAETFDHEVCDFASTGCPSTGTGIDPLFGAGVRIDAGHRVSFRVGADGLLNVGDSRQYTSGDFVIIHLDALYNF